jgi:hypothetical protein
MKNSSGRIVEPELLDVLPPQDQRALRSRHDLRRLNTWMNHPRLMARALSKNLTSSAMPKIAELGAGDGHFLLRVASKLRQWPQGEATLVDRLDSFDPKIRNGFGKIGWRVHTQIVTASEWLRQSQPDAIDAIICNLFLHQFDGEELAEMLRLAARSSKLLIALEPRRSWPSKICGSFLWAIGCGSVTRHDAAISIRAGFSGRELSAIWPDKKNWHLTECPVGLFSHLFIACRKH